MKPMSKTSIIEQLVGSTKCRLIKMSRKTNAVHSEWCPTGTAYTGTLKELPKVGQPFYMYPKTNEYFHTSEVQNVVNDVNNVYMIETLNSMYMLEVLS